MDNTPQLGKAYGCTKCPDMFVTVMKLQEHMAWHNDLEAKRAAKATRPSATEEAGITREPTAQEMVTGGGPAGKYARPRLADVIATTPPPPPVPTQVTVPPAEPQPLKLCYRFTGQCPTCVGEVETIEVSLPEKNAVTAYCYNCKKTVEQKLVIPIDKQ